MGAEHRLACEGKALKRRSCHRRLFDHGAVFYQGHACAATRKNAEYKGSDRRLYATRGREESWPAKGFCTNPGHPCRDTAGPNHLQVAD